MAFCVVFGAGWIARAYMPEHPRYTYYGLRIEKVVDDSSWKLISPETGPFVADFCSDVKQYQPRAGYVLCKLQYVDRGCMDVQKKQDGFWFVKGKDGATATLSASDTFRAWPACQKDELVAQGGN